MLRQDPRTHSRGPTTAKQESQLLWQQPLLLLRYIGADCPFFTRNLKCTIFWTFSYKYILLLMSQIFRMTYLFLEKSNKLCILHYTNITWMWSAQKGTLAPACKLALAGTPAQPYLPHSLSRSYRILLEFFNVY
jgi:hypothetical protein